MQSNPIVVDGMLYATTPKMRVIALDAATGREVWTFDPSRGDTAQRRFRHRGVTVYKDRVFVTYRNLLWALDRKTGKPIQTSATTAASICAKASTARSNRSASAPSSPGVIFEDMIIMGSTVPETLPGAPGDIRAYDVNTGKHALDLPHHPASRRVRLRHLAADAWKISGGANAWAGFSVDPKLGMVFAATGSASFDFYGSNRIGDNLFADCVLALDARTGKRLWHFQGVKHDLWDLDFPAAPSLVTVTRNGKQGRCRRANHQDRLRLRARSQNRRAAVSRSNIARFRPRLSMASSRRQRSPIPLKPPPFTRQAFTEDMVTKRTPEAHAVRARLAPQARFERHVHPAQHPRHGAVARHRWRRRMGRRGVRSRYGAALRQLE